MTVAEPHIPAGIDAARVGTRPGDGADDPVTGPMPAVELQAGRLRVHVRRGVTIVALDGGLDAAMAAEVAAAMGGALAGAEAVVLDLDRVTLLDEAAFTSVVVAFAAATDGCDRCLVASRLSGRMVLERWGLGDRYCVFTSVADALQARAFRGEGYGAGWDPAG
jgi:anti-anti-sigma regulatory factor